jgi:hypothetical protein
MFVAKDVWQTPDTVQTLLRYPDKEVQVYFEGTFVNARNAAMIEFMGPDRRGPVAAGVSAASAAHLANQSLREGRVAQYG